MLKCYEFEGIQISDPNTIDHLEVFFCSETAHLLKNVQFLKVDSESLPNENFNILSVYPKLKTLVSDQFDFQRGGDHIASSLRHLVAQKIKKPELKIYFQSVELIHSGKIEEYESSGSILAFQINNYNLLCGNISRVDPLDYSELMRLVEGALPDDFYKKYFNIESVRVSGEVKSQDHLVRFLKNFNYLNILDLENTVLDQTFFDGLHEIGQLTELRVKKVRS